MKKIIYICDHCGEEVQNDMPRLLVDTSSTTNEEIDLCGVCAGKELHNLLKSFDYIQSKRWLEEVRSK